MKTFIAIALTTFLLLGPAKADNKIFYGSRAGMVVTVVSTDGLDTDHAVIRTQHTREDAERFCIEYAGNVTADCLNQQLGVRLNDRISANCKTGEFVDFYGRHYRFEGRQHGQNDMANFVVRDLTTGEAADGSEASGYPVNMQIFRALCPAEAPSEQDE
jgi:hypothetical protein